MPSGLTVSLGKDRPRLTKHNSIRFHLASNSYPYNLKQNIVNGTSHQEPNSIRLIFCHLSRRCCYRHHMDMLDGLIQRSLQAKSLLFRRKTPITLQRYRSFCVVLFRIESILMHPASFTTIHNERSKLPNKHPQSPRQMPRANATPGGLLVDKPFQGPWRACGGYRSIRFYLCDCFQATQASVLWPIRLSDADNYLEQDCAVTKHGESVLNFPVLSETRLLEPLFLTE